MFNRRPQNRRDPLEIKLSRVKGMQAEILREIIDSIGELEMRQHQVERANNEVQTGLEFLKKMVALAFALIPLFTSAIDLVRENQAKEREPIPIYIPHDNFNGSNNNSGNHP